MVQQLYSHGSKYSSGWNFGPQDDGNRSVKEVIELMIQQWGGSARWEQDGLEKPYEANLLKLECSKALSQLGWGPKWSLEIAVRKTVEWQKAFQRKEKMLEFSLNQIEDFQKLLSREKL